MPVLILTKKISPLESLRTMEPLIRCFGMTGEGSIASSFFCDVSTRVLVLVISIGMVVSRRWRYSRIWSGSCHSCFKYGSLRGADCISV